MIGKLLIFASISANFVDIPRYFLICLLLVMLNDLLVHQVIQTISNEWIGENANTAGQNDPITVSTIFLLYFLGSLHILPVHYHYAALRRDTK